MTKFAVFPMPTKARNDLYQVDVHCGGYLWEVTEEYSDLYRAIISSNRYLVGYISNHDSFDRERSFLIRQEDYTLLKLKYDLDRLCVKIFDEKDITFCRKKLPYYVE